MIREGRGSVSLLQRALGIGYGRAARLIDFMAEDGIVGTYAGSQAREVLMTMTDWEQFRTGGQEAADEAPAAAVSAEPSPAGAKPSPRLRLHQRPSEGSQWDEEGEDDRPPDDLWDEADGEEELEDDTDDEFDADYDAEDEFGDEYETDKVLSE